MRSWQMLRVETWHHGMGKSGENVFEVEVVEACWLVIRCSYRVRGVI